MYNPTMVQWDPSWSDHLFLSFSMMFREQFSASKVKPSRMYDLFGMRQREGDSLRDYLNRFSALTVRLQTHDEDMIIVSFEQGIAMRAFSDSVIRNPTKTFFEVRE